MPWSLVPAIALLIAYVALPLLATWEFRRYRQFIHAVVWLLSCLVGPIFAFHVMMTVMTRIAFGDRPGDGMGIVWVTGVSAALVWLLLCLVAMLDASRSARVRRPHRNRKA